MYKKDIKLMAFIASAMFWGSGYAADNSVYIDQSGDNATVTVTQDGAGNVVRGPSGTGTSSTTPAKIYGNNNDITVDQIGSGNELRLGITTGTTGTATIPGTSTTVANPTVIYSVTGNNADAEININATNSVPTTATNYVNINQTGDGAVTNLTMTGKNNGIKVITDGGSNNSYTSAVTGDENSQNISMTGGAGNTADITQTGNGNSVTLTSNGATNAFTVSQTGAGSSSLTLSHSGTGNTFGITQSSSATGNNTINWTGSGSTNNVSITQSQ